MVGPMKVDGMPAEVTVGGVPICSEYGLALVSFEEVPPKPKTQKVEIPFGEDVDVTDAMGPVAFSNRTHRFVLFSDLRADEFSKLSSRIVGELNGKMATYELSWDEGATYRGRWAVTEVDYASPRCGKVTLEADVSPWKIRPDHEYTFSAYPAVTKVFESGRKDVRPTVETAQDVYVTFKGTRETFPKGAHSSSNLAFTWGTNEATFECADWYFYQQGSTLVVNDPYISYDPETEAVVLADEIIAGFASPTLTLDDSAQMVTVRYEWRDL